MLGCIVMPIMDPLVGVAELAIAHARVNARASHHSIRGRTTAEQHQATIRAEQLTQPTIQAFSDDGARAVSLCAPKSLDGCQIGCAEVLDGTAVENVVAISGDQPILIERFQIRFLADAAFSARPQVWQVLCCGAPQADQGQLGCRVRGDGIHERE